MYEWNRNIQQLVDRIEISLKAGESDELTLDNLAREIAYSQYHTTRHFKEKTGILFRDYLRLRKLAYSAIELRDSDMGILDIAIKYGFSSQEAYTRAFKQSYCITPNVYRKIPRPLLFRNKINTFDPYYLGIGAINMDKKKLQEVRVWVETIPAHKILYIKNYETKGYWDFWDKQEKIKGCDCNTISGLLDSISGKLDGKDNELGTFSGQLMFYKYEEDGKTAECYGVRLPIDYNKEVPSQMICEEVAEGEYIVFGHPAFEYETMSQVVVEKVNEAITQYNINETEYEYEEKNGRIGYLYHSPDVWGYRKVRPIKKK